MKYSRILGVAAALLVTSAVASQATPPAGSPAEGIQPQAPVVQSATVQPAAEAAPAPVAALADAKPATWGDAKAGQAKAGTCAACHGADGNSSDAQYPKLAGQHERTIWRQLKLFKSGERENPIMQPMAAALSEQDMRDLGAWFATQKVSPGVADDSLVAAGPHAGVKYWQVGERLFRGGNAKAGVPACSACHGPVGRGNPGPSYPSLGGQHSTYTSARLNYFRAGGDKAKASSAIMVDIAGRLDDQEIEGLSTYIEGLHPAAAAKKAE
ncbi:MAG: c-type cytochrome [Arenimonas sp.]